jgi:hypothetical protein
MPILDEITQPDPAGMGEVLNRNDHHTLDAKDHDGSMSHLGQSRRFRDATGAHCGLLSDIAPSSFSANNKSGQPYSMTTYSAPQIQTPKWSTLARLIYSVAFRRLIRHRCQHNCFLRRCPKIPRRLQRAPDIGIFRAAIESNQLHTVWALHLIAVAESLRPLAERLAAFGAHNLYPVGHEILPQGDYQAVLLGLLTCYLYLEALFPALQRSCARSRPLLQLGHSFV